MDWIEIISIRLSKQEDIPKVLGIFRDIKATWDEATKKTINIYLYQSKGIESDWAIHLFQKSPGEQPDKSQLGHAIIEAFRPFGLVNHSVWESKEGEDYGKGK
jgi:hypothetical protein